MHIHIDRLLHQSRLAISDRDEQLTILPALNRRSFVCVLGTLGACAVAAPVGTMQAFAAPSDEKQAEAQAAFQKLQQLQSDLDARAAEYGEAMIELEETKQAMWEIEFRMDQVNGRIEELQERLSNRARSMYRTGSASFIDLLVGSTTFKAFATNWNLLNDMSESDAETVEQVKQLRDRMASEKAAFEGKQQRAQQLAEETYQMQIDAQKLVDDMTATHTRLSAEAAELLEQEEAAHEAEMLAQTQQLLNTGSFSTQPSGAPRANTNIDNTKKQFVPGELVVERAYGEIGKKYVWGACGPDTFDCSGLVSYCLCGQYGRRLGTTYTFYYWTRVTDPQPGDICVNWEHCGIYIGDGQMIHAPNSRKPVQVGAVYPNMIFVRF